MQGSKYDDAFRANAVAMCTEPKMTPSKVAKKLGIPSSTVYDWYRTAQDSDPDTVAIRRNKLRKLMDRAYSISTRAIESLDRQSKALKSNNQKLDQLILKLEDDGRLDEQTIDKIHDIIRNYTDVSMTDIMKVLKESLAISEKFENVLSGEKSTTGTSVNIYFADE